MRRAAALDREILRLAVPALATLVAEPLLLLADTWIVGHVGTPQLAGLTVASNVIGVLVGLSVFLAYGTTATVGRLLGRGDRPGALAAGLDGMVLGALLGALLLVGLEACAPLLLDAYGADPVATGFGVTYLRIVAAGLPAQLIMLAATGILRGLQDTRTPLLVVVGVNALNIVLNATLVFGARMGIAGSATGTAVAQWLGCAVLGGVVLRGARREDARLHFTPGRVLRAARSGIWLVVRSAALQVAIVLTTATAAHLGRAGLAGHQIVSALWQTTAFALDAFAIAAQALIAVRLGASDLPGVRAVMRRITLWSVGFSVLVGLLLAGLRPVLAPVFSPDPTVQSTLLPALLVLACAAPVGGVTYVVDGILIGAGDARYLALAAVVATALYAPLTYAVRAGHGTLWALWLAYAGWIAIRAVTLVLRARGTAWMRTGG